MDGSAARLPRAALGAALAVLLFCVGATHASGAGRQPAVSSSSWDVVLILTDDQPAGTLNAMPQVQRLLVGRGTTYPNAVVPTSICCPSRTSLLTGLLASTTGIYSNESATGFGGYPAIKAAGLEKRTIATALDAAGYTTGYFGKYLNEYGPLYDGTAPPGWDTWRTFTTWQSGKYRRFPVTDAVPFGQTPRTAKQEYVKGYSTTYFGRQAAAHIRGTPVGQPMFTVFAPYAPHSPFTAQRKYRGMHPVPGDYANPSIMEQDVSDKPDYVRQLPAGALVEGQPPGVNLARQLDTLRSVDDQVRALYDAVRARGTLGRTLFVYVSDNGYLHGEHRLEGKAYPYRRSTDVPLVLRWGAGAPGAVDDRLTIANVDVAATILHAAGLPNTTEGTSVLADRNADGVQLVGPESATRSVRPPFCAWRTREELFVRYGSAEEEYYDYRTDPHEVTNRVGDPAVATRVEQMRESARRACSPTPPGYGPDFDLPRWRPIRGDAPPMPPEAGGDRASRA